jgi:hypothetical protein
LIGITIDHAQVLNFISHSVNFSIQPSYENTARHHSAIALYDDALLIGLGYGRTMLSNSVAPNADAHRKNLWVPSVLDMKRIRLGKGERNMRFGEENKDAKLPHWVQFNIGLLSTWGLFAEMNFNRIINRHTVPNGTQRIDLCMGYRFCINRKA